MSFDRRIATRLVRAVSGLILCFPVSIALADIRLAQAGGGALELEAPAQRLVTLAPHLTELAYEAGAGDRVVATVEYSEFPQEASVLPRIGNAFRLDVERVVALRPDLVIAWQSGNPQPALSQLERLGLAVWYVEIREPEEIAQVLASMGRATGRESSGSRAARALRVRLEELSARFRGVDTVTYFYQVAPRPLFTINGEHLISKGLKRCGGANVFEAEPGLAFQVSHEAVIAADPAALLAPHVEGEPNPLESWLAWPDLEAVTNGALFLLAADKISRATPRWLDSLEHACRLLDGLRKRLDDA